MIADPGLLLGADPPGVDQPPLKLDHAIAGLCAQIESRGCPVCPRGQVIGNIQRQNGARLRQEAPFQDLIEQPFAQRCPPRVGGGPLHPVFSGGIGGHERVVFRQKSRLAQGQRAVHHHDMECQVAQFRAQIGEKARQVRLWQAVDDHRALRAMVPCVIAQPFGNLIGAFLQPEGQKAVPTGKQLRLCGNRVKGQGAAFGQGQRHGAGALRRQRDHGRA